MLLNERMLTVDTNELAVSLARTGAFFSNDQAPLSSRTVRFISREHFPPTFSFDGRTNGVKNTPSGALWDIENTNRGCGLSMNYLPGMAIAPLHETRVLFRCRVLPSPTAAIFSPSIRMASPSTISCPFQMVKPVRVMAFIRLIVQYLG